MINQKDSNIIGSIIKIHNSTKTKKKIKLIMRVMIIIPITSNHPISTIFQELGSQQNNILQVNSRI